MLACETSGKGATGGMIETGKTKGEPNLSTSRLPRMSRASRVKDRITWDGVVSMDREHIKSYKKGLTDPGTFDKRDRIVLTDCSAPSLGAAVAASRFLVVDSSIFLENVCCRASVVREQAAASVGRACERPSWQ
jgi:hypothetical protein